MWLWREGGRDSRDQAPEPWPEMRPTHGDACPGHGSHRCARNSRVTLRKYDLMLPSAAHRRALCEARIVQFKQGARAAPTSHLLPTHTDRVLLGKCGAPPRFRPVLHVVSAASRREAHAPAAARL